MLDAKAILAEVVGAFNDLWRFEPDLAEYNAGELAVSYHLTRNLTPRFPEWNVDPEWTRRKNELKRLSKMPPLHGGLSPHIRPDIIVHRRGKQENLLVIELKRHDNRDIEGDVWKLEGMTAPDRGYAYAVGLHLVLNIQRRTVAVCDVYCRGAKDADLTAWLRQQLPS